VATVTMKQLLEAGVHFGHQVNRWNPKMDRYIFGAKNGIYVIDLQQTVGLIASACDFLREITAKGGTVLFVGTKKQAQETVVQEAGRCGMFYVKERWIGGALTNFGTVSGSMARLRELRQMKENGGFEAFTKKELSVISKEMAKLEKNVGGLIGMNKIPNALFVVDPKREKNAIKEALKLEVPVIALIDTNGNPDEITYPIPGNDDAIKSVGLIVSVAAEAIIEGKQIFEESKAPLAKEGTPEGIDESAAMEKRVAVGSGVTAGFSDEKDIKSKPVKVEALVGKSEQKEEVK